MFLLFSVPRKEHVVYQFIILDVFLSLNYPWSQSDFQAPFSVFRDENHFILFATGHKPTVIINIILHAIPLFKVFFYPFFCIVCSNLMQPINVSVAAAVPSSWSTNSAKP